MSESIITMASSTNHRKWKYDVFLSFRGEDTRNNFTGHLHNYLLRSGINVFRDSEKLKKGEEISPALLTAIGESRFSLVIFSRNYVSSTWCLNELVEILQCVKSKGHLMHPIFYDVDPSDLRYQKGNLEAEFDKHEKKFQSNPEVVQKWRSALTEAANLSGWHLGNGDEPEFIQKIVKDISGKKLNSTNVSIAKHPVGIDSHLQNINRLLDVDHSEEVRKVGIYGCKGIGKTTIAKAIYNWHYSQFDRCCFLMDVRDRSKDQYQIVKLQKLLLHEILGEDLELGNMDRGSTVIKERLCHIKVLIVIDGVEDTDPNPLDKLAEKLDWFGPGSRIIITTTDKHLLDTQDVQLTYEMSTMDRIEAIQLFSWHAFKRNKPIPDYMKLVNVVVRFTKGIPLALVKMGSDLCSRSMDYWERKLLGNDVIEPKGEKSTTIWIVLSKYVETHYNDETGEMHPNLQELFKGALEFPSDVHPKFDMNILKQCHDVDWKDDDFDLQKIKSEQFDDEASHRDSDRTRYDEIGKQGVKARQGQSENIYAGKTRDFGKGCQSMNAFQAGTENPYHSELSDDDAAKQGGFDNPHYGERGDDDTAWKGGNGNTYDSEPEDNDVVLQGGIDDSYDGEPVDDDGAGGRDNLYYGEPGDDDSAGQSGTNDPYCGELEDDDVVEKGGNDSPYYGEPGDDGVAEYGGSHGPYDSEPEDDDAARQGEYDGAYYGEPGDNDFAGQDGTDDTFYGEPENDDAAVQGGNDDQYYGELEDDDVAGQGENDSPYYGGETGDDDAAGQGDNETPYYGDAGDDDVAGQAENDSPYYDEARDDEDSGEGEDNN